MKSRRQWTLLIPLVVVAACGVEFLKPLTVEQAKSYPTAIAMAKDRYTSTRIAGPLNLSNWSETSSAARAIASFQIPTNATGAAADYKALIGDMRAYCEFKGGTYDDFSAAIAARWQELRRQNTQVVESNVFGGSAGPAAFECGPEGRGTVSSDWTRFNPSICRPLYTTTTDVAAVKAGIGNPPNFGCKTNDGALFIGKAIQVPGKGEGVFIQVRLNEGLNGVAIPYSDFPQMQ